MNADCGGICEFQEERVAMSLEDTRKMDHESRLRRGNLSIISIASSKFFKKFTVDMASVEGSIYNTL
jgi:hypothetical protein